MQKDFLQYVYENKKLYKYTVKIATHDITDGHKDMLIHVLEKYSLKSASDFRKTPIQESPLDFPNSKYCPVFISDVVLEYPASHDMLRQLVANAIGISEGCVVVYLENDPRKEITDLYIESKKDTEHISRLATDFDKEAIEQVPYGEKYNTEFLKELEKVRKERGIQAVENNLSTAFKADHKDLPAGYNDIPTEDTQTLFGKIKPTVITRKHKNG